MEDARDHACSLRLVHFAYWWGHFGSSRFPFPFSSVSLSFPSFASEPTSAYCSPNSAASNRRGITTSQSTLSQISLCLLSSIATIFSKTIFSNNIFFSFHFRFNEYILEIFIFYQIFHHLIDSFCQFGLIELHLETVWLDKKMCGRYPGNKHFLWS